MAVERELRREREGSVTWKAGQGRGRAHALRAPGPGWRGSKSGVGSWSGGRLGRAAGELGCGLG